MKALWNAREIAEITGGDLTKTFEIQKITTDHREVTDGVFFVALRGSQMDGHEFVESASKKKAAGSMVRKNYHTQDQEHPLIYVEDTKIALDKIAASARNRSRGKFIGVTGSVGKTSIKEALLFLLSKQGRASASQGSYNNHVGVPLTLVNFDPDLDYAVVEMGMNHKGEILPLSALVRPDIAIITGISPAHLGNFETLEEIAEAKAEIFGGMGENSIVILNKNNSYYDYLKEKALESNLQVHSFGLDSSADAFLMSREGDTLQAFILNEKVEYTLCIKGEHWVLNSLCILLAVKLAGGDVHQAAKDLNGFEAIKGRGRTTNIIFDRGSFLLIDDSYNANPDSMKAGIEVLGAKEGRKVAILGDMLELGERGAKFHLSLVQELLDAQVDRVYACGPLMGLMFEMLPPALKGAWKETSEELLSDILPQLEDGDVVFVKGSKGSRMSLIVCELEALKLRGM